MTQYLPFLLFDEKIESFPICYRVALGRVYRSFDIVDISPNFIQQQCESPDWIIGSITPRLTALRH
jgi:hypothetical protein